MGLLQRAYRVLLFCLLFISFIFSTACSRGKGFAFGATDTNGGLGGLETLGSGSPFGNGNGAGNGAVQCEIGEDFEYVTWARFRVPTTGRVDFFPVFKVTVRATSGAQVIGVKTHPQGAAHAHGSNPTYVIFTPPPKKFQLRYRVAIVSQQKEGQCASQLLDYDELTKNIPPKPRSGPNFVAARFPRWDDDSSKLFKPARVRIEGPSEILTLDCVEYDVTVNNLFGLIVPATSDIEVHLNVKSEGTNAGAFFSDSNCKTPLTKGVRFRRRQFMQKVYFMAPTEHTAKLSATPKDKRLFPHEITVNIRNNPAYQRQICINFEDWGGDWDHNDSVVDLGGTLVVDGDVIRSFGNQTVDVNVFDTSSLSACRHAIRIRVIDIDLQTGQETINPQNVVNISDDHVPGSTHRLTFKAGSRLEVFFYTHPGSICSATEGRWIKHTDKQWVRAENVCRDASDEGNDVRGG